jgi:biopolymer transport protein ExbD
MSFGSFSNSEPDDVMSEINMTPLVDVMLVLLIVFMITVPVIQHAVKLDLPQASNRVNDLQPSHVNITIRSNGIIHWNDMPLGPTQLQQHIATAVHQHPQPELHLYAERHTPYEKVAQVMAAAQQGGIQRIGFITNPKR